MDKSIESLKPGCISVTRCRKTKTAIVEGDRACVMLFFTLWQNELWKDWFCHEGIDKYKPDYFGKNFLTVMKTITRTDLPLVLLDGDAQYSKATDFACDRIVKLGFGYRFNTIEVSPTTQSRRISSTTSPIIENEPVFNAFDSGEQNTNE